MVGAQIMVHHLATNDMSDHEIIYGHQFMENKNDMIGQFCDICDHLEQPSEREILLAIYELLCSKPLNR